MAQDGTWYGLIAANSLALMCSACFAGGAVRWCSTTLTIQQDREMVGDGIPCTAHCPLTIFVSWYGSKISPSFFKAAIPVRFQSHVVFIGTWIAGERRDEFLLALIDRGVNVSIWGDRWQKAPSWPRLQAHWRGAALGGKDYVAAIQGSKIALGLLSHGNRDLHTTRSSEIPYAGGLLCAERTSEHLEMYREGVEAVFWKDAEECAAVCRQLLADDALRERIRRQGMERVSAGGYGNEAVCQDILTQVFSSET
jgi:spore maturation protein CgeB